MMTRRVVVLVLSAALASGLVIGVSGAVYGVRDLLTALGIPFLSSPPAEEPYIEPVPELRTVAFTFTGKQLDGSGRGTVVVRIPEGWRELVKAELWRDFHDPSEELNLRIRADLAGSRPEDAAAAHQVKNDNLPNYILVSSQWVDLGPDYPRTYELRYSYTDKGRTRHVIETFFGEKKVYLVGGYYWEGQEDDIREPMDEAIRSFDYTDKR